MTDERDDPVDRADTGDDIEIIEVIGFDEDDPSAGASAAAADPSAGEIELTFAEDEAAPDTVRAPAGSGETAALRERFLRLRAEFENFKKRTDREKDEFYRHAVSGLVERLLPVIDNFERAVAVQPRDPGGRAVHEGVMLIHRQLIEELKREGLRPLETLGQRFDPACHEAVATEVSDEHPPNTVIEELQRGYLFHDRLLRPASVLVSVGASDGVEEGEEG